MSARAPSLILTIAMLPALAACSAGETAPPPPPPLTVQALAAVVEKPGVGRERLAREVDALFSDAAAGETRALVVFSGWNPIRAVFGCYLFGIMKGLALKFQGVAVQVFGLKITFASQVMDMIPYLLTIVVLLVAAITSKNRRVGPAGVGKPYFREDR